MQERPRVVIVDDDDSARETIQDYLWQENYELVPLNNGQELLEHFETLMPDVILLDVMMPGLDGFEVCRRIKADEKRRHVPVILITALDSHAVLTNGTEVGADDFLPKPVIGLELRARVRSMSRIKAQHDELSALLHLREDLTNMIVHDIRNPLAVILLFGAQLRKIHRDDGETNHIDKILTAARRLESFVNDMLIIAKAQENRLMLRRQMVEMNQLIRAAEAIHNASAQQREITLVVELPDSPWYLSLDEALFQRVLDNLLSNAIKFSQAGSTIHLRATPTILSADYSPANAHRGRIQIADNGPGIPQVYQETLFQKFNIVDLKRKGIAQVGLGLAFCKLVVDAHGGHISVEANQPTGAIFTVEV